MATLLAIATRKATKEPMVLLEEALVTREAGLVGDGRGKPGPRQVTILAREGWLAACKELDTELPWTLRRANLLVEGISLADTVGRRLRIGDALLQVTEEAGPCQVMDLQHEGLRKALGPEWRGGVCCKVVDGGRVSTGAPVRWE